MRVLTVTNMYPSESRPGWGAFVRSQVQSLIAAGIETDVEVIEGYRSKLEYARGAARVRARLRDGVRNGDYDLVHAHYGLTGLVARMQGRAPLVVSFCGDDLYGHSDAQGRARPASLPLAHLHRRLAHVADGLIVKTKAMRELLPASERSRVAVIPNGVDFERFAPGDRAGARAALGLADDVAYVLFPYDTARPRKNFALVEAAIARAAGETGRRIEPLVVWEKPAEVVALAMQAADCLALASYWEGSPNVVKEAMAACLPVVTVDVGDTRDVVEGAAGCSVVARAPEPFAAGLIQALAHDGPTDGRERIAHLRADRVAAQVIDVYKAALARAGREAANA